MNNRIIILLIAIFCFHTQLVQAQVRDSQSQRSIPVVPKAVTPRQIINDSIVKKKKADSLSKIKSDRKKSTFSDSVKNKRKIDSSVHLSGLNTKDSATILNPKSNSNQVIVSVNKSAIANDSLRKDSLDQSAFSGSMDDRVNSEYQINLSHKLLLQNKFINIKQAPIYFLQQERKVNGKEILFYSICTLLLFLGVFKTFFHGYFNNLFRVFFNTSLRQSQLTDQLVQAKLPSLILNLLFVLSAGMYAWLLFSHLNPPKAINTKFLLPFCIGVIAIIYLVKYILIKFMGWVAGIQSATNNYIFIIFLINKIIGILLIPFIILVAFSNPTWIGTVTTISYLLLGLFFLARYIKSYGSLDNKLRLNPYHFAIYIIGGEILPLMILYKIGTDYLFL